MVGTSDDVQETIYRRTSLKISIKSIAFAAFVVLSAAAVLIAVPDISVVSLAHEPAGFVLLGTGVLGGAALRKRRIL